MFSTKRPTFASAMGLFSKARAELTEAAKLNDADLAEAQKQVQACTKEKNDIDHAASFLDNLLRGANADEVASLSDN